MSVGNCMASAAREGTIFDRIGKFVQKSNLIYPDFCLILSFVALLFDQWPLSLSLSWRSFDCESCQRAAAAAVVLNFAFGVFWWPAVTEIRAMSHVSAAVVG